MGFQATYGNEGLNRADIDHLPSVVLLEFGVDWCPHCQTAQPGIEAALRTFPGMTHIKIEDGPGRPLGRSFQVKRWPTLILMKDGQETDRVVRPTTQREVGELLLRAFP